MCVCSTSGSKCNKKVFYITRVKSNLRATESFNRGTGGEKLNKKKIFTGFRIDENLMCVTGNEWVICYASSFFLKQLQQSVSNLLCIINLSAWNISKYICNATIHFKVFSSFYFYWKFSIQNLFSLFILFYFFTFFFAYIKTWESSTYMYVHILNNIMFI